MLLSQHQPHKDTSKEGLFDRGGVLIPYESILRSMCPSEKALEVRASVVRSESYRLEPCFDRDCSSLLGAFSVTRDPSQHRQRSLDSSRPGPLGSKLIVAYQTPFLIISKIGCPFPLFLRRRKASLTVDCLQQNEPSLFGSSSAQCQCGILPFTGRPNGSMKKRRSCAILRWSLSYRGTQTPIVSLSETKNGFVLSGVFP